MTRPLPPQELPRDLAEALYSHATRARALMEQVTLDLTAIRHTTAAQLAGQTVTVIGELIAYIQHYAPPPPLPD